MGSDLHMSPPSPDERRIVRSGTRTALYTRHTDGIYTAGTKTWFRKHFIHDPEGLALHTLKVTMPGVKVLTLDDGAHLTETLPYKALAGEDRDIDAEVAELQKRAERARERARAAYEESITYDMQATALLKEAGKQ